VKEYCCCIWWAMKPLVYHDWHPLPKNPPTLLHLNFLCLFPEPWFSSQPLFLCVCRRQK
jgi:hypothetical protein